MDFGWVAIYSPIAARVAKAIIASEMMTINVMSIKILALKCSDVGLFSTPSDIMRLGKKISGRDRSVPVTSMAIKRKGMGLGERGKICAKSKT